MLGPLQKDLLVKVRTWQTRLGSAPNHSWQRPALLQVSTEPIAAWCRPGALHASRLRSTQAGAYTRIHACARDSKVNPDRSASRTIANCPGGCGRREARRLRRERHGPRRHGTAMAAAQGPVLIDCDGIVRWANIECAESMSGIGRFPSAHEILTAARSFQHY